MPVTNCRVKTNRVAAPRLYHQVSPDGTWRWSSLRVSGVRPNRSSHHRPTTSCRVAIKRFPSTVYPDDFLVQDHQLTGFDARLELVERSGRRTRHHGPVL